MNLDGPAQWRVPVGLSFFWATCLGVGILFFPETPRHEFRNGKVDSAAASIAKFYGISTRHKIVKRQLDDMQEKMNIENEAGKVSPLEVFTGPRMLYRILLGVAIQALQQMTGANFFFYYGTTLFDSGKSFSCKNEAFWSRNRRDTLSFGRDIPFRSFRKSLCSGTRSCATIKLVCCRLELVPEQRNRVSRQALSCTQ